jgi:hypothetical protein
MAIWNDDKEHTMEEYNEYVRREEEKKRILQQQEQEARRAAQLPERKRQWAATKAGKLLKQLGEIFEAYREMVENDPRIAELGLELDEVNQKIFDRMRTRIERAQMAPRCQKMKADGEYCRAPRVRGKKYCHMHLALEDARPRKIGLPTLEDPNGIQVAIQKGAQGLLDGTLERKDAGLLAYYLQLAVSNVNRVNFEPEQEC